jgi:hypothetical protein
LAGRLFRGIDPDENTSLQLQLSDADALGVGQVTPYDVPAGWTDEGFEVGLITHGGVVARGLLGEGDASGGSYRTLLGLGAGDFYTIVAAARVWSPGGVDRYVYAYRAVPAEAAGALSVRLPDPVPEGYAPDLSGEAVVFGLEEMEGADAYRLSIGGSEGPAAWLSSAWRAGRSSYTWPDLAGLPGFGAYAVDPDQVRAWGACALNASVPLADLLADGWGPDAPAEQGTAVELGLACASR